MNWFVGNVGGVTDGPYKSRQIAQREAASVCKGGDLQAVRVAAGFYTVQTFDKHSSLVNEMAFFTEAGALRQGFKPSDF